MKDSINWFACRICSAVEKTHVLCVDLNYIQNLLCRRAESIVHRLILSLSLYHQAPLSLNETLFFRPWPTQNIWLCLSYCYINVASFIHSGITNSVKVVCFKAFMHKSNSNLCSTACWGLCNPLQHFPDRQIMNEVSGTVVSFLKTTESKLNKYFYLAM